MQNIWYLTGWNNVHISDIFNCYGANINGMWHARKIAKRETKNVYIYTNLKHTCVGTGQIKP